MSENSRVRFRAIFFLSVATFLLSCDSAPHAPEVPAPSREAFSPAVREQFQPILDKARGQSDDPAAVGEWGRMLYAYRLYQPAEQAFFRARALAPESFEWTYFLGVTLADQGKFPEAEQSLRSALELRPDNLPSAVRLADLLEQTGDQEQALEILTGLPGSAAVRYRLGRLYAATDAAKAKDHLLKALQLEPDYREALNQLASVYTSLGLVDEARKQIELFEQADPTEFRHYEDPLLDELVALKARDAKTLYDEGLAFQRAGDAPQALSRYNSVLEGDPKHAQAHVGLIAVYGMMADATTALKHFELAVAINPNISEAHYNLGLIRYHEQDYEAAVGLFTKALEITPTDPEALGNLAVSLELLGRGGEAERRLHKALESDPLNAAANFHLGRRLAERRRYREALPFLAKATARQKTAAPSFVLALVHKQLGNPDLARRHGAEALEHARSSGQEELASQISAQLGL